MTGVFTVIGMATTAILTGIAVLVLGVLLLAAWNRALTRVSNHFFDKENVRRMRVAAVVSAIKEFKPHKIPAVWREAEELVEEND